ncbi:MAG: hypothetical protein IPM42_21970 [Saprospiraceae bacterium]|nr:hypothetical protein [Saprospiraceae bacterium]
MNFKNLFILLILFSAISVHGQPSGPSTPEPLTQDTTKLDTVQLVLLFSQCALCSPQTDVGFGVFKNKGTKEKPKVEIQGYLNRDGTPIKESTIVWMVNIPQKRE